jgi:hypothetical protein
MAAFLSRGVDGIVKRGSRRALVKRFWTPTSADVLGLTTLGASGSGFFAAADGKDIWIADGSSSAVRRVRGSDGRLLKTWTGAAGAYAPLAAMGRIFVTGSSSVQRLYSIDPRQPAGAVTTVTSDLPFGSGALTFDGSRIWIASSGGAAIVTPGASLPWSVSTASAGFAHPWGILYDGSNVWMTDSQAGTLLKLDANGAILQTVTVGIDPHNPVFDGTNIWVPNNVSNSVSVVRASSGALLSSLTDAGLDAPNQAAFDGERVLVTSYDSDGVTLWKAADLSAIGSFSTGAGTHPFGAVSDGFQFWLVLAGTHQLARF